MFRMLVICFPAVGRRADCGPSAPHSVPASRPMALLLKRTADAENSASAVWHSSHGSTYCAAYTPITPTPVLFAAPLTMAVYAPGCSVIITADSFAFDGARPFAWICAALGPLCQSSLLATTDWSEERTMVSVGLASGLATPYCASEGPVAVTTTVCGPLPCTMKPPIITSLPVSTSPRVARLMSGDSGWSTSYAATMPTPVDPFAPETIAVYAPGGSVTRIADSRGSEGAKPLAWICAAFAALRQP